MPLKIEIPEIFYSDATGKPFERCIDCECSLLDGRVTYLIEKAVKRYPDYHAQDTIFEYAICMNCSHRLYASFSGESRKSMDAYFNRHSDQFERHQLIKEREKFKISDFFSACIIKGIPLKELNEYQLVGQCRGNDLLLDYAPYMVSGAAIDEVAHLLSNQTIDTLGGFIDDKLGLPPELRDILKDQPAFIF